MTKGSRNFRPQALTIWSLVLIMAASIFVSAVCIADTTNIPTDSKGLPLWKVVEWKNFPVKMTLDSHDDLEQLLQTVNISEFDREQLTLVYDSPKSYHIIFKPRVTEEEAAALEAAGYKFERVRDIDRIGRQEAEATWAAQAAKGGDAFKYGEKGTYPNNAQIGAAFDSLAIAFPTLARKFSWGLSIEGRDLQGLVISNDVQHSSAEPEVRFSSTMHGNEPVGTFLQVQFARYLLSHYGVAGYEDVTNLVDNYEIHLMPLHNPDGMASNQRYNANSVDLNRNFLEPGGTHTTVELENTKFIAYANNNHFVISQNDHGGALVVNYEWDYTYTLAVDDAAIIKLSLEYSTTNLPMYNGGFSQGITNGADWYVATGTLQDWSYYATDCIDVTVELDNDKWPPASRLDGLWNDNRESYMNFTKAARYGINGVVTAAGSGLPLDAKVTVVGNSKFVSTDPAHGDYYKLLDTGTYDVTVEAYGYITQTINDVYTVWGTPTVLNVEMQQVAHGEISGELKTLAGEGLSGQINVYSYPGNSYITTFAASAAADGYYTGSLVYGDYRVVGTASGYFAKADTITIGETDIEVDFNLPLEEEVIIFADDFEGNLDLWVGNWGFASPAEGYNSDNCLDDSPGDKYLSNANNTMTMASGLDLSASQSGELRFYAKWEIENSWDACFFEVSTDGGSAWTPLATQFTNGGSGQGVQRPAGTPLFDNSRANWVLNTINMAPYIGQSDVRFRFRLASDSGVEKTGFYLDNFEIEVTREQISTPVQDIPVLVAGLDAFPNPFNPTTTINYTNTKAGNVELGIYDLQGRLVRKLVSEYRVAGAHEAVWNGKTNSGGQAASGVYFAKMVSGSDLVTSKIMLVK